MAIKSVVDERGEGSKPKYPRLMRVTSTGTIVLMDRKEHGTVVKMRGACGVGYISGQWSAGLMEPFPGSVTLSNEED